MRTRVIFLILFLLLSGCGLFSTRVPEQPDTSNTFIWTPTTTVDYLLNNFIGTVQLLDASNYERVFISTIDSTGGSGSKNFTFVPMPGLDQSSKSVFTGWTAQSEQAWLAKLKSLLPAKSQISLLLSNEAIDQTSNTANISADYTISIPVSGSSTVIPSVVQGSFQMQALLVTTEQGTKEWRIVSWSDFQPKTNNGNSTWTNLKVKLSS